MKTRQLAFELKTWGGKRKGAGRKPNGEQACLRHGARPVHDKNHPVHVTLRLEEHVYNLRSQRCMRVIAAAFRHARDRFDFRLVHFAIEGNHLHLLVEAADARALSRGIKGLSVRVARGLNRLMGKKGRVFADRYHARALRTPLEVKRALNYVFHNAVKHYGPKQPRGLDPYSSASCFDGWARACPTPDPAAIAMIAPPGTWLLAKGWRRHGLLDPYP